MNITIEADLRCPRKVRRNVDRAVQELRSKEPETRQAAAEIIRAYGLEAYIGGHHVAIFVKGTAQGVVGGRVAIITHTASDWN